jgi:D-amino-acid dehydrogenase
MQTRKVDVIVVGGGVIGVSIAYYTASRGASVLLIERGRIGSGSSYGNAGLLVPSHCQPLPSPGVISKGLRYLLDPAGPFYVRLRPDMDLARWLWSFCRSCTQRHLYHSVGIFRKLSIESLELHQELAARGGSEYEYTQKGLLTLYSEEKSFNEGQDYASLMKSYGIEATVLSSGQVREMEPHVGPRVIGGLFHGIDGSLDPAAFVGWLARETEAQNVQYLTDTEVFWLEASHRKVTKVSTTHGDFRGDQIVLASGAWIPRLALQLGIKVPIRAAKGYSMTFQRPENSPMLPLLLDDARVAVTPYSSTLRLAGTLELSGMDPSIDRARLEAILSQTYHYLPTLGGMDIKEIWAGIRPCTPDGLPVLGKLHPYSNVFIAGGHGTKGMLLGPVTGQYMSRMLSGESIGMMERSLKANRF